LKDLEQTLDMRPGSIYAAFGSKAGLLCQALDRYSEEMGAEFFGVSAGEGSAVEGIRRYSREVARACAQQAVSRRAVRELGGGGGWGGWPPPSLAPGRRLRPLQLKT